MVVNIKFEKDFNNSQTDIKGYDHKMYSNCMKGLYLHSSENILLNKKIKIYDKYNKIKIQKYKKLFHL